MTRLIISAELFKLRTVRGPWIAVLVLAALVVAGLVFAAALIGEPGQPTLAPDSLADLVRGPGRLVGGVALLLGLLLSTGEYRHGTMLTSRTAQPDPVRTVLGKAAAAAIAGGLVAVIMELITLAGAAALYGSQDVAFEPLQHSVPAALGSVIVVAMLHALAGVGIGELLRSPALAVGAVLGWVFIVEGILPSVFGEPGLGRWLPAGVADSALSFGLPPDASELVPGVGVVVLAGYALGLVVAGAARAQLTDP
jgi:ABC-2 type transport system permease protein